MNEPQISQKPQLNSSFFGPIERQVATVTTKNRAAQKAKTAITSLISAVSSARSDTNKLRAFQRQMHAAQVACAELPRSKSFSTTLKNAWTSIQNEVDKLQKFIRQEKEAQTIDYQIEAQLTQLPNSPNTAIKNAYLSIVRNTCTKTSAALRAMEPPVTPEVDIIQLKKSEYTKVREILSQEGAALRKVLESVQANLSFAESTDATGLTMLLRRKIAFDNYATATIVGHTNQARAAFSKNLLATLIKSRTLDLSIQEFNLDRDHLSPICLGREESFRTIEGMDDMTAEIDELVEIMLDTGQELLKEQKIVGKTAGVICAHIDYESPQLHQAAEDRVARLTDLNNRIGAGDFKQLVENLLAHNREYLSMIRRLKSGIEGEAPNLTRRRIITASINQLPKFAAAVMDNESLTLCMPKINVALPNEGRSRFTPLHETN